MDSTSSSCADGGGSLLIDEALYAYRLHAATAPRQSCAGRRCTFRAQLGNTYAKCSTASVGLRATMSASSPWASASIGPASTPEGRRAAWPASWVFIAQSWFV